MWSAPATSHKGVPSLATVAPVLIVPASDTLQPRWQEAWLSQQEQQAGQPVALTTAGDDAHPHAHYIQLIMAGFSLWQRKLGNPEITCDAMTSSCNRQTSWLPNSTLGDATPRKAAVPIKSDPRTIPSPRLVFQKKIPPKYQNKPSPATRTSSS